MSEVLECANCGKSGAEVQCRPVDGASDVPVCDSCLAKAEKFYSQKQHENDLKDMKSAVGKLIGMYDMPDTEKLPQHELASHLESVVDELFELREKIKEREKEVSGSDGA